MNVYIDTNNIQNSQLHKELTENYLKSTVIIARSQDTRLIYKSQLLSYVPEMNKWNFRLKIQYHLISIPKYEVLMYKYNYIYTYTLIFIHSL